MSLKINLHKFFRFTCGEKYSQKDLNRYISKIDTTPGLGPDGNCWEYRGSLNTSKYGSFSYRKNSKDITLLAHRVAYELFYNKLVPINLYILHHCDNRRCCNPDHLFLGTLKDNMQDMLKKGRNRYNHNKKLTWLQVGEIRKLYATGKYTQKQLGIIFGVSGSHISDIIDNKIFKDSKYNRTNFYDGRSPRWSENS